MSNVWGCRAFAYQRRKGRKRNLFGAIMWIPSLFFTSVESKPGCCEPLILLAMTFFANHVWTLCFDLTIMVVTPSEEHLSMASKQKLAGNGLATTSANATTASGSRKSRRSSQNHLPIIAIVKLIQLLGVQSLNKNFSQLLQPAKTFKFFLKTLSCNSSMSQPNRTISTIINSSHSNNNVSHQMQQLPH